MIRGRKCNNIENNPVLYWVSCLILLTVFNTMILCHFVKQFVPFYDMKFETNSLQMASMTNSAPIKTQPGEWITIFLEWALFGIFCHMIIVGIMLIVVSFFDYKTKKGRTFGCHFHSIINAPMYKLLIKVSHFCILTHSPLSKLLWPSNLQVQPFNLHLHFILGYFSLLCPSVLVFIFSRRQLALWNKIKFFRFQFFFASGALP